MRPMIYLDNAATTPVLPEIKDGIASYIENYGNPSSAYEFGQQSKTIIELARTQVANVLGCSPENIYFTSGGTEANNWALISTFDKLHRYGNHIITSKIEHHSILNTCKYLERYRGAWVTYLDVDRDGIVDLDELESLITDDTILVSIMTANNEIGTIQPIMEINKIIKEVNPYIYFHTDAVQAFGHIDLCSADFDMCSASAHKIGGLKGTGFIYIDDDIKIDSFIHGGGQERGMRASTENILGIYSLGYAAEYADTHMEESQKYVRSLRDYFEGRVLGEIPDAFINGCKDERLAGTSNITFLGIRSEQLLRMLDTNGICVSAGSACNSSSTAPSHVLKAIGLSDDEANSSIRFTFGIQNTQEEIDYTVAVLKRTIEQLRR